MYTSRRRISFVQLTTVSPAVGRTASESPLRESAAAQTQLLTELRTFTVKCYRTNGLLHELHSNVRQHNPSCSHCGLQPADCFITNIVAQHNSDKLHSYPQLRWCLLHGKGWLYGLLVL